MVFEYAGQDVAKVEIKVNDGEAIENTLKRGKISGWKVDQDGFELAGAKIGLFRFDETKFTEETALMVTESNEIGYFEFDKVPVGNWLVREIAPPAAFVLTEETFPVEITEDGQTIEIRIENQIIKALPKPPRWTPTSRKTSCPGLSLRFTPMWTTTANSMRISTIWWAK